MDRIARSETLDAPRKVPRPENGYENFSDKLKKRQLRCKLGRIFENNLVEECGKSTFFQNRYEYIENAKRDYLMGKYEKEYQESVRDPLRKRKMTFGRYSQNEFVPNRKVQLLEPAPRQQPAARPGRAPAGSRGSRPARTGSCSSCRA